MTRPIWEEESDVLVEEDIGSGGPAYLIVHNDQHNTFEWVIQCFVEVLAHESEQAEQLAYIIHFKGKATVKTAAFSVLRPLKTALCDRGLAAVIEGDDED